MGDIEFYEKQILQYAGRFGSMPKEFLKPQGQKVYHIFCGRKEDDKNYMLGLCGNYFFDDRTEEDGFDEDYYMCEPAHKPLKEGQVKCVHCMKAYATGLVDDFMTKLDWGEYCVASLSQRKSGLSSGLCVPIRGRCNQSIL